MVRRSFSVHVVAVVVIINVMVMVVICVVVSSVVVMRSLVVNRLWLVAVVGIVVVSFVKLVVWTIVGWLNLLGVVVEHTDEVESNRDHEDEVDADEDPNKVINVVIAVAPVEPVSEVRFANLICAVRDIA